MSTKEVKAESADGEPIKKLTLKREALKKLKVRTGVQTGEPDSHSVRPPGSAIKYPSC